MIWFTSDHHFDHANIIKFCKRPFKNVDYMNTELVNNWNETVALNDKVYVTGDFTLGGAQRAEHFFRRLNGEIHIIPGGHDHRWLGKNWKPRVWMFSSDGKAKATIELPLLILKFKEYKLNDKSVSLTLCHYPMRSWERSHYGMPHIHGHVHNTWGKITNSGDVLLPPGLTPGKSMDIGVDAHIFRPISLEEVMRELISS